jgi:hypothetical protein
MAAYVDREFRGRSLRVFSGPKWFGVMEGLLCGVNILSVLVPTHLLSRNLKGRGQSVL